MAKYIKFDFSDCECEHFPIIVRFEDISIKQIDEIEKLTINKINHLIDSGDYWDNDEMLVVSILDEYTKNNNLKYEIVGCDYTIVGD